MRFAYLITTDFCEIIHSEKLTKMHIIYFLQYLPARTAKLTYIICEEMSSRREASIVVSKQEPREEPSVALCRCDGHGHLPLERTRG
jgi:hypothetical protein